MTPGGASARHQRHGPSDRPRAVGRHRSPAAIVASLVLAATALGCGGDRPPAEADGAGASPSSAKIAPEFTAPIVFQRFANTGATPTVPGFYGGADIWIMEGDGSGLRLVRKGDPQPEAPSEPGTTRPPSPASDTSRTHLDHPSLTFDLRNVVYAEFADAEAGVAGGARLFREDLATGERAVLREVEGCAIHHASISPITRQLVYTRNCPEGDGFNRSLILELSDRRQIDAANTTALPIANGVGLRRAVLFQAEGDPEGDERRIEIAVIRFDGYGQGTYTALTDRDHRHRRPAVSADGQMIAWQTNSTGPTDDIFLADIDGANQHRLTTSEANDGHPWFSRDGRWIVFESDRSGNWEIWKIEIETGQVVQLTDDPDYVSTRPRW